MPPFSAALGAALAVRDEGKGLELFDLERGIERLLADPGAERQYFFPALDLEAHAPADGAGSEGTEIRHTFDTVLGSRAHRVEVDTYQPGHRGDPRRSGQ